MPFRLRNTSARLAGALALCVVLLLALGGPAGAATRTHARVPATGIVDVFVTLGYQSASAAGTGMAITRSGEVLTNNHVIHGATSIRVVDVATGHSYSASVIGYSVGSDVALLRIQPASVATIPLGHASSLKIGSRVQAAGNAGGVGGAPKVVAGSITGLHRSILAQDEQGGVESLKNLIETNAPVRPGDSGGPLLNKSGRVVGMITAGSPTYRFQGAASRAYAIRIDAALAIARQIAAGQSSTLVHIGPTAFLGVTISTAPSSTPGVLVKQVLPGTAAEAAGLAAGDVITSLDDQTVTSPSSLQAAVLALQPGTPVQIAWTDPQGNSGSAQITPASGPPQ